ncbi:MAG TPA: flagellar basal body P-ring formation chaperone FlgA [Stellaceae bacterium]|nr:flagellar basal body P-ring formation chaperone FlgA [Stellaceae bacterium]
MMRFLAALVLAGTAVLAALPAAADPTLRPAVTVDAAVIRLGDLFADAGAHAGDVLAPAPPPGATTIFDANWLAAAAREHGLAWQPGSSFDRAAVERATRVIDAEAVTERLRQEIARSTSVNGTQIQLDNGAFRLLAAKDAPDTIAIEGLSLDARTGRFSAMVSAPADDAAAERQRITGRLVRMARLMVLNRPVTPGDVIAQRDIEAMELPADRAGPDALTEARELVGKTPRHPLQAHQPLHAFDVQTPVIVHKDDLVTIVLETPSLRLSTQGKALEDGGLGATIHVANTKSNRVIDATVTGHNLVTVAAATVLADR